MPDDRTSKLDRTTDETTIHVEIDLDGGDVDVAVDDGFFDHMLDTLARYAGIGLTVDASGDLRHHVIEDAAIVLGRAVRDALGETPTQRFGHRAVPMDDALVLAAVDLVERPFYDGDVPKRLCDHALRTLAMEARFTLHVVKLRGRDDHHVTEAAYKAVGLALSEAIARRDDALSTKGAVREGGG